MRSERASRTISSSSRLATGPGPAGENGLEILADPDRLPARDQIFDEDQVLLLGFVQDAFDPPDRPLDVPGGDNRIVVLAEPLEPAVLPAEGAQLGLPDPGKPARLVVAARHDPTTLEDGHLEARHPDPKVGLLLARVLAEKPPPRLRPLLECVEQPGGEAVLLDDPEVELVPDGQLGEEVELSAEIEPLAAAGIEDPATSG